MSFKYDLYMKQQQKLVMTESMQQSIKVLQMSNYELYKYINDVYEQNPLLDGEFGFINKKDQSISEITYNKMLKMAEFDSYSSNNGYDANPNSEDNSPFKYISKNVSLKDFLYEQLNSLKINEVIRNIIQYMIEDIDERGYLGEKIEDICNELKVDLKSGQDALKILQGFDPIGIGARNLQECLEIQLQYQKKLDENLHTIIMYYLELIAENKYKNIAKSLKITEKQVQDYADIIKSLEPKPSRGFYTGEELKFIIPDAYIENTEEGLVVRMNDNALPRIKINKYYSEIIINNKDQKYLKQKGAEALALIKSIHQRKSTLYSILEYVVKNQEEYFIKGEMFLKKMTLQEVSESLSLNISTISRAIKEKYILTSFGTIKVRSLFVSGSTIINSANDENINIKNKIKSLIDSEDKKYPLSDQTISDELKKDNLNISRRTVTKYRQELGIKSSAKRKRI